MAMRVLVGLARFGDQHFAVEHERIDAVAGGENIGEVLIGVSFIHIHDGVSKLML